MPISDPSPAAPRVITVRRYVCPFCSRGRSKEAATRKHIDLCWKNLDNKACLTCAFYEVDPGEPEVGLQGGIWCDQGVDIGDGRVVTNCEKWGARP